MKRITGGPWEDHRRFIGGPLEDHRRCEVLSSTLSNSERLNC